VDAGLVSRVAGLLGRSRDRERYAVLAARIRDTFRRKFVSADGWVAGDCQAAQACALYQGMVDPGAETAAVASRLVELVEKAGRKLDTGILGTKYLLHSLSDTGRPDLAYALVAHTEYPGWGYMIARGATTLWETWAGDTSQAHHMFSDVSAWFYRILGGIAPDPLEPGFRHIRVKPHVLGDLSWVKARHRSPYGWVESSWRRENGRFHLELAVPVGCRATVTLPDGKVHEVRAGRHRMEAPAP
jgi:alpha-L-rhamnosidase